MSYGTTLTLGNTGVAATEYLTRYFSLTDRLYDEQDQLLLNTPEALETLRLLLDARPCVQPSYSKWWRETAKAFAAGDTAMTVLFSNYASEITGLSTKIASDIGTTFVPGGNPLMGGGSIGVCRYSQNKKEALNFIRWLCSEEIASAMTYLGSASPCQATYDNYQIIDLYPWLALTKESMTASHVKRWPQRQGDGFNERKFLNIMGLQIMHAINGFVEPATAVQNMQKEMERII